MDSIASFTIETGGQKCHVMWMLTNQQAAWECNALRLPREKMLWNPSHTKTLVFGAIPPSVICAATSANLHV